MSNTFARIVNDKKPWWDDKSTRPEVLPGSNAEFLSQLRRCKVVNPGHGNRVIFPDQQRGQALAGPWWTPPDVWPWRARSYTLQKQSMLKRQWLECESDKRIITVSAPPKKDLNQRFVKNVTDFTNLHIVLQPYLESPFLLPLHRELHLAFQGTSKQRKVDIVLGPVNSKLRILYDIKHAAITMCSLTSSNRSALSLIHLR